MNILQYCYIENLGGFTPIIDSTGKITGYKTEAGADTVFPFYDVLHTTTFRYSFSSSSGKRTMNISSYLPAGATAVGIQGITVGTYELTYAIEPGNILSINGTNSGTASSNVTVLYR